MVLVFDAAVLLLLSEILSGFILDVVGPSEPLPHLPVARAVWKPRPSLAESAESWLLAGAPHHTVLSSAMVISGVLSA